MASRSLECRLYWCDFTQIAVRVHDMKKCTYGVQLVKTMFESVLFSGSEECLLDSLIAKP